MGWFGRDDGGPTCFVKRVRVLIGSFLLIKIHSFFVHFLIDVFSFARQIVLKRFLEDGYGESNAS